MTKRGVRMLTTSQQKNLFSRRDHETHPGGLKSLNSSRKALDSKGSGPDESVKITEVLYPVMDFKRLLNRWKLLLHSIVKSGQTIAYLEIAYYTLNDTYTHMFIIP